MKNFYRDVKEYFNNETRYNFLAAASFGHSVPAINSKGQSYGKEYYTEVIDCKEEQYKTFFKLDLTKAYNCDDLTAYVRSFLLDYKNLELSIKDEFKFNKPNNQIKEIFITRIKPEIVSAEKILICAEKSITELKYPKAFKASIEECSYNDHSGKKCSIYRIVLSAEVDEYTAFEVNIKIKDKL